MAVGVTETFGIELALAQVVPPLALSTGVVVSTLRHAEARALI